jgi:hypothetical protein
MKERAKYGEAIADPPLGWPRSPPPTIPILSQPLAKLLQEAHAPSDSSFSIQLTNPPVNQSLENCRRFAGVISGEIARPSIRDH